MTIEETLKLALCALEHNHYYRAVKDATDPEWPRNGRYFGSGAAALNLTAIAACQDAIIQLKGQPK